MVLALGVVPLQGRRALALRLACSQWPNRYFISVKRPSGGTDDTVFDWVEWLSLCLSKVVRSVGGRVGPRGYELDARVKERPGDGG